MRVWYCDANSLGVKEVDIILDGHPRACVPFCYDCISSFRQWRMTADFIWYDGRNVLRFRKGFQWNGEDVPWVFRWYEGVGEHLAASGPHDYLYGFHCIEVWNGHDWEFRSVKKRYADLLWKQILEEHYECKELNAFVLWTAVHVGGWIYWIRNSCTSSCEVCSYADGCPLCFKISDSIEKQPKLSEI